LTGENYTVSLLRAGTVRHLKEKIATLGGPTAAVQCLLHRGERMEDGKRLSTFDFLAKEALRLTTTHSQNASQTLDFTQHMGESVGRLLDENERTAGDFMPFFNAAVEELVTELLECCGNVARDQRKSTVAGDGSHFYPKIHSIPPFFCSRTLVRSRYCLCVRLRCDPTLSPRRYPIK
jgi:hypothetical protein